MLNELFSFVESSLNTATASIEEAGEAAVAGLRMINNSAQAALSEQLDSEAMAEQRQKIDSYVEERENARFLANLRSDARHRYYNEIRANTAKMSASQLAGMLKMSLPVIGGETKTQA